MYRNSRESDLVRRIKPSMGVYSFTDFIRCDARSNGGGTNIQDLTTNLANLPHGFDFLVRQYLDGGTSCPFFGDRDTRNRVVGLRCESAQVNEQEAKTVELGVLTAFDFFRDGTSG